MTVELNFRALVLRLLDLVVLALHFLLARRRQVVLFDLLLHPVRTRRALATLRRASRLVQLLVDSGIQHENFLLVLLLFAQMGLAGGELR